MICTSLWMLIALHREGVALWQGFRQSCRFCGHDASTPSAPLRLNSLAPCGGYLDQCLASHYVNVLRFLCQKIMLHGTQYGMSCNGSERSTLYNYLFKFCARGQAF
eukprot:3910027-Amphidinium_carterae.2